MLAQPFEVHVRGQLPPELLEELDFLSADVVPAQTVLTGVVPDQAALFGLLTRLQGLGLELVEVRRLPASPAQP
ncbi:hypothetical protein [Angustibacter luteus]|uniref:Biopolymer transporter ExbD n=1 Tax=Angustibacter luteus TaxID=658456 RepID=A0ABW1JJQ5_9ACTN